VVADKVASLLAIFSLIVVSELGGSYFDAARRRQTTELLLLDKYDSSLRPKLMPLTWLLVFGFLD
jgi:hypothetical protein